MRGLEQARYQARRSFKRRIAEKETQNPAIIAKVGNGAGTVVVSGRPGWIYIRLHGDDNQLTEAKLGIPLDIGSLDDAWVRVRRASSRKTSYYVVEEFITSSTGNPVPPMSAHPLDPDAGPHTGTLPENEVAFDDGAGHDHQGATDTGKKVDYTDLANKEHAPTHKSGGGDEVDVKDLPDSEGRLLTGVQKTDLTDEGLTTLHRHAGGATSSVLITLMNRTGGQRESGDVVVVDVSNDESFTGTDQVGYVGKVFVVGETIADLTGGQVWERGGPFDVKVIGTVSRNSGLRTSATIYRAEAAPSITGGGVFAIALAPNISGEGTVKAVFLDAVGGTGAGAGIFGLQWHVDGPLATATEVGEARIVPAGLTSLKVYIYCKTPGITGSTIVDVNKNGTSIFTTQANRPTLPYDDPDNVAVSGTPDITALAEGDVLTIDIDETAVGAADLAVLLIVDGAGGGDGDGGNGGDIPDEVKSPTYGEFTPIQTRMDKFAKVYFDGTYFVVRISAQADHYGSWITAQRVFGYGTYEWKAKIAGAGANKEVYVGLFEYHHGYPLEGIIRVWNAGGTYKFGTSWGGAETVTNLAGQDWTTERTFKVVWSATDVYLYVDDVEKAHHNTNIPQAPMNLFAEAFVNPAGTAVEPISYFRAESLKKLA